MKYSLNYDLHNTQDLEDADEIICTIMELGFLMNKNTFKDKTIVLNLDIKTMEEKEQFFQLLEEITSSFSKVKIKFKSLEILELIKEAEEKMNINLNKYYAYPANNSLELESLCERGMSDVIIAGELLFSKDIVNYYKSNYDVEIRAIPNKAQFSDLMFGSGLRSGWIRPEDLELYSSFIDIIDFKEDDIKKEKIIYSIYAQDKKWDGDLSEIIYGLNTELDSNILEKDFALKRINCNHKCSKDGSCHFCDSYLINSQLLSLLEAKINEI